MSNELYIRSDRIFTADPEKPVLFDGYIKIVDDKIDALLTVNEADIPDGVKVHDYTGHLVTPGFIDAHTHLVHAGSRHHELGAKLRGESYLDIHEMSGILYTVRKTRDASYEALYERSKATLQRMLACGVTTLEAKSGYGLDKETEIRCLEVARDLNGYQWIDIESTFMGAHAIPPEFEGRPDDYLDYLIKDVLPVIKRKRLARFVDVFCEDKFFTIEQSERFLKAAKEMGFLLKIHADEITSSGGAELAAKLGCVSAEHLMAVSDKGIKDMAKAGTVACVLPNTTYFLMEDTYAPVKKMLKEGVTLAISTDYNPGSSPTENIQFAMALAVFMMKMNPVDVLLAVTRGAAAAIDRHDIGQLKEGYLADIFVSYARDPDQLFYRPGSIQTKRVFKKGKMVYRGTAVPHILH